jgi:hypothetical protein
MQKLDTSKSDYYDNEEQQSEDDDAENFGE